MTRELLAMGEFATALELMQSTQNVYKDGYSCLLEGAAATEEQQFDHALSCFQDAQQIPREPAPYKNMIHIHIGNKRQDAISWLREGLSQEPHYFAFWDLLGFF